MFTSGKGRVACEHLLSAFKKDNDVVIKLKRSKPHMRINENKKCDTICWMEEIEGSCRVFVVAKQTAKTAGADTHRPP
jgi:hypothetical protein